MANKRRGGTNFDQSGPSPAKVAALNARWADKQALMAACKACPYALAGDLRCAWMCALARDTLTQDPRR